MNKREKMNEREKLIKLLKEWGTANTDSVPEDEISDYLLENGVIVLPVKVGDTVYRLTGKAISTRTVNKIEIGRDGYMALIFGTTLYASTSQIGKTVFFTKEEAEAALKAMGKE